MNARYDEVGLVHSPKRMDWQTPPELFHVLDGEFNFGWDAAATADSNVLLLRKRTCVLDYHRYFGPDHLLDPKCRDALTANWISGQGPYFLNPPYGREQIAFIRKAEEESRFWGSTVVCLLPARPDTIVFHEVIMPAAAEVRFLKGRLTFVGADAPARFPSMIVVFDIARRTGGARVRCWDWRR